MSLEPLEGKECTSNAAPILEEIFQTARFPEQSIWGFGAIESIKRRMTADSTASSLSEL
jgi:hypothetical protein